MTIFLVGIVIVFRKIVSDLLVILRTYSENLREKDFTETIDLSDKDRTEILEN